ncbi:uncharacterized protein MYCFIDRAFT_164643 [Pseudocercospora fijiensis CIRAD86]|uniref:Glucose receptor Git3 N-terminal domain-containing protein n=1 Tax=Pseudocercospora fijiensis (strain CIRAD86) TaxID=383855 RepID=M3B229_PSEFD|nr:uncharacterized protein MYCFIDRAFT_164643 [Pseudocercospora fijiensis CIRAD86]EME83467.1 hypothetical protein MYCFIDRAFT_164643 [Pseudocercospora fijiensis CIRAD86]
MPLSLVVAIPTFVCSLLSLVADATFVVFYVIFPPERHFRQALIVNLLAAGESREQHPRGPPTRTQTHLINSANNTISGAFALARRNEKQPIPPGPGCVANGYVGQFSVQAIDFSILVISLSVLLTIRQSSMMLKPSMRHVVAVCAIPWIPPLVTANIALAMDLYGPVSGNWCWIEAKYFGLRYALTHAWRISIFAATIAIYTYIYIHLMRTYGKLAISTATGTADTDDNLTALSDLPPASDAPKRHIRVRSSITTYHSHHADEQPLAPFPTISEKGDASSAESPAWPIGLAEREDGTRNGQITVVASANQARARARKQAVRKMLLLNGYPICYIILWIPGITNRIYEAFGPSPIWLRALQASTQLVGFANALTYAYNEQFNQRIRGR